MYDPLHHTTPGVNEPYPDSYWASVSGQAPQDDGQLTTDIDVDVCIIGAGYTGLSTALHLAKEHGIKATVVEANQTAWGCSGRNAGFILKTSGRKSFSQMKAQWGEEVMRGIYCEMQQGVETVNALIGQGIDCDRQPNGYIKVAHKANKMKELVDLAKLQQEMFGYDVQILSKDELHNNYMADQNAYGAIRYQDGFGLNPLKLAWGYQRLAREAGVKIYSGTTVEGWREENTQQVLQTPKATIRAKKVVIATNGYTPKGFHSFVAGRTLPVLSQIIVTEPLSDEQIAACNLISSNVVMDTRALKYYYRKLPDNRLLFGGRGAISGKDAEDPFYANRLLSVLKTSFPALQNINYQYAWAGWISVALDDLPHIYQNPQQNVFYSMGYCGAGVSFSVQAGKRLAQKVAEQVVPDLPLYQKHLPKFPFAPFRRVGQWGYFHYGQFKDTYL
ncbi:FAD-binding oxidoreductase [Thalassotalea sp. LPB0316]|uniref:NAD(P)/FAD-dependent oxidoreductase n=1 Tax=Thalassotalea sp. LPB0316 TaxID=2769490 RepID=UPI001866E62B|nr:FAD-binding oxidoreductase [Thalassotalea sp. LPB0316]QOL25714.1 FAD-binding oxidoreductase [Thalassotalea sp. LPB0316]